jgi:hypothetical protein
MRKTRAIPAGVEVEDLRVKNTPPANNLILKSEARLGGSFTIPLFQNLSKKLQKKFAFPAFGGIVTNKGLETLTPGGSRADIVGKSSVYIYSKSILGLPGSIILLAQLGVRFQPGKPFLFVLGNANRKLSKNCLTPRRQSCHKTNRANSPSRNSARISNAVNALLAAPTKTTRTCHLVKTPLGNSRLSRCGSMTGSTKSRQTALTVGLNPSEQIYESAVYKAKQLHFHYLNFNIKGVFNYA